MTKKFILIEVRKFEEPLAFIDSIEKAIVVKMCTTCGAIFGHVDYRLGQCPIGHDQ